MYEIRLCNADEIDLLTTFIENSWSDDHIFLRNRDLLDFQHKGERSYNFVVAYHKETNSFHGVLGIIAPSFYTERNIRQNEDIWLAIWKVDKNLAKSNSLGMDMLNFVEAEFKPKSVSAIGINQTVALLYKLLGFKIRELNQWFIENKKIIDYKLIKGELTKSTDRKSLSNYKTIQCGLQQEIFLENFLTNSKSKRSIQYLVKRYLNHPTYKYKIYAFINAELEIQAVFVGREVEANGARALRLTELFIGSTLAPNLTSNLEEIMEINSYEYIDFMEYGFDENFLVRNGFIKCTSELFVPHLFEPFVADHKEVNIAYKSQFPFSCTKGDSDLDRPNQG